MKNMTLLNISKACGGKLFDRGGELIFDGELICGGKSVCSGKPVYENEPVFENDINSKEVQGVVIDSRLVKEDYLFVASRGERVDGHDFIKAAFNQGAMAVVCEKAPEGVPIPYILVKDSLKALKDVAEWYRMQLDISVIGITGSVGKTSTKEFVSSVLSQKYRVHKTEGNYNNEIGLPLTILQIRAEHEIAVLEMGISNFGEMHRLSKIAKPDYCLITNIGQCHLENLGSRQGILKAKSEIFDFMNENGRAILNGDDDMLATVHEVKGKPPVRYGFSPEFDVWADNVKSYGLKGSTCDIHIKDEVIHAEIPMPGHHMVLNSLAAAAAGLLFGISGRDIARGIDQIKPVSGRSNIIQHKDLTIIDDCYNANPVSMKAAIDLLSMADTRKVAIMGDMGELGRDEIKLHEEVGRYAGAKNIDIILCAGKLSSHMYDSAREALNNKLYNAESGKSSETSGNESPKSVSERLFYFETRDDLIKALPGIIKGGDTILVKASHFMGFDMIVKELLK